MPAAHDVLDRLLTDPSRAERDEARRLVTFLRLLRDDARGRGAEAVGLDLGGARAEWERTQSAHLARVLGDLLAAYLRSVLPIDGFASLGESANRGPRPVDAAWHEIAAWRQRSPESERAALPGFPGPDDAPLDVAERVLASARSLALPADWLEVWEARAVRARDGVDAADRRWRTLRERAKRERRMALEAIAVRELAEARLDRGDVTSARALLTGELLLAGAFPELAWLAAWSVLLDDGDDAAADEFVRGRPARTSRLPQALVELRRRVPDWRRFLSGEPPTSGARPEPALVRARQELGASVLAVFVLGPHRELRRMWLDVAGELAPSVRRRSQLRHRSWTEAGTPEYDLLHLGQPVIRHRCGRTPGFDASAALAGKRTRSVALVPLFDPTGDPFGWLHVESDGYLLPSESRLAAIASAWADELRAAPRPTVTVASGASEGPTSAGATRRPRPDGLAGVDFELREFGDALLARLPMKLRRRRAVLVSLDAGVDERFPGREIDGVRGDAVASRGGAFERLEPRVGRGQRRVIRAASSVRFEQPSLLALFPPAGSGICVPLVVLDRIHGLLAVESTRRGDFCAEDEARLSRFAAREAQGLRAAQFRAWHGRRFGVAVWFDPSALAWQERVLEYTAIARSSNPVWIDGAAGAGKKTLARWLHFESGRAEAPLVVHDASEPVPRPDRGSWVLDDLERFGPHEIARVCDSLAYEDGARGIVVGTPAARCSLGGFERIHVPRLEDRRDEIPTLARVLAGRVARETDRAAVSWDEDVDALLFRQPWRGNVSGLLAWVRRVTRLHAGRALRATELASLAPAVAPARSHGGERATRSSEWAVRVPTRTARRADLLAALVATRSAQGAWNKTRAARFLGWDRGTLTARMRTSGLAADGPGAGV